MNKTMIAIALSAACATGAWAWFSGTTRSAHAPENNSPTLASTSQSKTGSALASVGSNNVGGAPESDGFDPRTKEQDEDARMSSMVPGTWETNREGRRVLTVLKDGTATMDVTVEGAFAFVVGSQMRFNIKWKIEDGSLDFEMIDGQPESSVNAVISLYGKKRVQKILEFSPNKFVLKDNDGDEDHVWSRIPTMKSSVNTDG